MRIVIYGDDDSGEKYYIGLSDQQLDNSNFVDMNIGKDKSPDEIITITLPVDELMQAAEVFDNLRRQRT